MAKRIWLKIAGKKKRLEFDIPKKGFQLKTSKSRADDEFVLAAISACLRSKIQSRTLKKEKNAKTLVYCIPC